MKRGFIMAAAGLICSAQALAGVKMIESKHGDEKSAVKVLIAYASKAGSTAEVADRMGKALAGEGAYVEVKPAKAVKDISGYTAVVAGSPIYMGKIMGDMNSFLKKNKEGLKSKKVACFVMSGMLREDTPENRKKAQAALDQMTAHVSAVDTAMFAAMMDYSKLGFFNKTMAKAAKAKEGDWRDWKAIEGWAKGLAQKFK